MHNEEYARSLTKAINRIFHRTILSYVLRTHSAQVEGSMGKRMLERAGLTVLGFLTNEKQQGFYHLLSLALFPFSPW